MNVLVLAPQPFFIERGTPIAVKLLAQVLSKRSPGSLTLLSYQGGKDLHLKGVQHERSWAPGFLQDVGPGISWKKLLNDVFFTVALIRILWKNRRNQFNLLHAVEESVFLAYFVKLCLGIPYVYDMDSSMSDQVVEKWTLLSPLRKVFEKLERMAVKGADAVVAVCDSLADTAKEFGAKDIQILRDIPLDGELPERNISLRDELKLTSQNKIILYVGNLESYQGIDLLIDSYKRIAQQFPDSRLVIVGGSDQHQEEYRTRVRELDLDSQVIIAGRRPVDFLSHYLSQADILASPRTKGTNTPMKVYSYLHSGVPVLATCLKTHTQVMTKDFAKLADPYPEAFSEALAELLSNPQKAKALGDAAKEYASEHYTLEVFQRDLNTLYDQLESRSSHSDNSAQYQISN